MGLRSFQNSVDIRDTPQDTKIYNNLIVQNDGTAIHLYDDENDGDNEGTIYFTNYEWLQGTAVQGVNDPEIEANIDPFLQLVSGFQRPTNPTTGRCWNRRPLRSKPHL